MARKLDKELEQYRDLLEVPTEFKTGFGWSTVAGIFFCGLIMLPGSIYLSLMTGGSMGAAGTWVTVILFAQVANGLLLPAIALFLLLAVNDRARMGRWVNGRWMNLAGILVLLITLGLAARTLLGVL